MKQVQISEELFTRLCAYHLFDRREPLQVVSSVWQPPCTRTSRGLSAVLRSIPAGR